MKTVSVYFSATYTTKRVMEHLCKQLSGSVTAYDLTNDKKLTEVDIPADTLLVVGIPVYAGRVPAIAVERIRRFKGNGGAAIAVAVYGNRHYDDALLELCDILKERGFRVASAAAFIAQHSIFPKVGSGRPDSADKAIIEEFAKKSSEVVVRGFGAIEVPGNRPYKVPGGIPIWPSASKKCSWCGRCACFCPAGAIDCSSPRGVDKEKCIKCGRCIVICPLKCREFRGVKYMLASYKFNSAFAERREPELFFAE